MCLAIPGKILSLESGQELSPLRMGKVAFGGIVKKVSLVWVPEAKIGDYVIVHAGFAISKLDEEEARHVLGSIPK
jgi:hydrogenase expression/formation protein HypC